MSHNTISLSCYFQLLYILKHTCTVHCQINMTDLFLIMQTLDGDFFDQLRGYFTTLGQVEVDACKNAMLGFETVVSHANTVSWIVFNDGVKMKLVVDLMKNPGIVGCIHSFPFCVPCPANQSVLMQLQSKSYEYLSDSHFMLPYFSFKSVSTILHLITLIMQKKWFLRCLP